MNAEELLQIDQVTSFSGQATEWFVGILPSLIGAISVLVLGWIAIGWFTVWLHRLFDRVDFDEALEQFIESFAGIMLKFILIVSVVSMLGVQTSSLVAILGAMSLAVGLALQGSLANFAGGVLILIFKPFRVGDLIDSQGFKGKVKEIQIFNTILESPTRETIVLPNGQLSNNAVINTTGSGEIGIERVFGIGYDDDVEQAKEIIRTMIESDPRVLSDQGYKLGVQELGASSVDIFVRITVDPADYWDVLFDLTEGVKRAFDEAGISFPFPQQDVHLYKK